MAWTLVKNEPGAGAAAPLGSDWTEQAGVANWAKDGSGSIVPGESYETAVRYTTELASADMAVEAQISAAAAGDMNHFLIIRSDAAINDDSAFDSVRIFGSEVYYNGAYQDPLSYGNLPSFVTDPVIRLEAQGSTYTFIFDGTPVGTLTARLDGTGGQYAGFKGQGSSEWLDLNIYVWEEEGGTEHTAAADFSGTGTLVAAATRTAIVAVGFSGTGTLAGAAAKSTFGAATFDATGTLAAAGTRTTFGAAALTGSGTLDAAATVLHLAAAAFTGSGTLSASFGATEHLAAAAFTGTGTLGAAANTLHLAAVGIDGTGTFTAAAVRTAFGTVGLTGTGSLSAAATATLLAAVGLTGTGTLTAAASLDGPGLIQLTVGPLAGRWAATPLASTTDASDLVSPWAATPLQGDT